MEQVVLIIIHKTQTLTAHTPAPSLNEILNAALTHNIVHNYDSIISMLDIQMWMDVST